MEQAETMERVLRHFDHTASRFDAIYSSPRPLDRIFRRDIYDRFHWTLEQCEPIRGRSVLDVGCGSGQYAIALAQRGAGEVVGLDFARNMISIAEHNARQAGVADRCRFIPGDFLRSTFPRRFDYVMAIGVFDYVRDPAPFLERAHSVTRQRFIASFPRLFTWRAPVRKLRLRLGGCPVYFYTRGRVAALMRRAKFVLETIEVCGKLYLATGRPAAIEPLEEPEAKEGVGHGF